jgi:hypothetical protein
MPNPDDDRLLYDQLVQSVSSLINTSVEDARSSARFCSEAVLREASRLAELRSRKTLIKVLKAELRRREKGGKQL